MENQAMATKKEIKEHLDTALKEIGAIEPWWSDEDEMYVFEHSLYPRVMHADPDKEETRKGYLRALTGFIEDRLSGNLAEMADKVTSGRGGRRPGAGRPRKGRTVRKYLPVDVAQWLDNEENLEQVRKLMGQ
jgi:hypothetical protein